MKAWPATTIGAVCQPTEQRDPRREPDVPFRYIDISGIDRSLKVIAESQPLLGADAPSRARKVVREGDILVSTVRPNLNAVALVPDELDGEIASTGFCVLRPNRKLVCGRFLFYRTISPDFVEALSAQVRGANYPAVSDGNVRDVPLNLPPLSEQRRIVELLDQADHLRRLRTEANTKADRILPALFLKMFGDPATNPMGWAVVRVADVAEVQGGLQLSRKRESDPIQVPYLRVANVYRERLELGEIKMIGVTENELERTRLAYGDVLVVEGHGNKKEIGRCAVWNGDVDPCVHQNHLIRIRCDRLLAGPRFLSAYLNSSAGRQQLLKAGKTTSGLNTISVSNVKKASIYLPPLDQQHRFEQIRSSVDVVRSRAGGSSEKLDLLWGQLLLRGFSGDLTACWRTTQMNGLLRDMEEQAEALAEVTR